MHCTAGCRNTGQAKFGPQHSNLDDHARWGCEVRNRRTWRWRRRTCRPMNTLAKARNMAPPPMIQCQAFHVYLHRTALSFLSSLSLHPCICTTGSRCPRTNTAEEEFLFAVQASCRQWHNPCARWDFKFDTDCNFLGSI